MIKRAKTRFRIARACAATAIFFLAACSGGGGGGSVSPPSPPPPTTVSWNVLLQAADVVASSGESGTASGVVTYNVTDSTISATVSLVGVAADTVSLRQGFAGEAGSEIYPFTAGASPDQWVLDSRPFSVNDIASLNTAALYLLVSTSAWPDGALRGQVVPAGVSVERLDLTAIEVTGVGDAAASGVAWLTIDGNEESLTVHVRTDGLDQAEAAELRQALAGADGAPLQMLAQDPNDVSHWLLENAGLTAVIDTAISGGELYVELRSPTFPDGAVRGQLIPAGMELMITDLSGDAVVMGGPMTPATEPAGRLMTTLGAGRFSAQLNLYSVIGADQVQLRQAPAGQNGPAVAEFAANMNDVNAWALLDQPIDATLQAALDNRTLYVNVTTPAQPAGAARGQLLTAASVAPPDPSAFVIESVNPANAAEVTALPAAITLTLNRNALAASVTPNAVTVEASGGDGSFSDGNEVVIVPASVAANGNTIAVSLAGVVASPDVYRTTVLGGGADGIVDESGIPLDGDVDGEPGGIFGAAFEFVEPPPGATLGRIQNEIFTPSCATAGCHSGNSPPDGLNLSAGMAYTNTVNVNAVQMPNLLRVSPGNPDDSYLVRKIQGNNIAANRMPLGAAPLSQAQIDLVRQWVLDGAPNN